MTAPSRQTRSLVLWCPDWPVLAARREHGLDPETPVALTEAGAVHSCSAAARRDGVQRGLRVREAQFRSPELVVLPYDPVLGRMSPLAPPVAFRWEEGKAIGEVTYGRPYEGPPGCVHGGVIALAFDQVLSLANLLHGTAGPTASLRVRFRKPTPLGVPLRYEGWRERAAGRRIHAAGRLVAGDVVTAEAEGTFVHLSRDRVMRMLAP